MRERVKDCEEQVLYFNFDACMVLSECLCISLVIVYCTVFQLVLIFLLFCSLSVFSRSFFLSRDTNTSLQHFLYQRDRESERRCTSARLFSLFSLTHSSFSSKIFHSPSCLLESCFCCLSDFDLLAFLWSAAGSCNAVCLASSEGFEAAICAPCIHLERLCLFFKDNSWIWFSCPLVFSFVFDSKPLFPSVLQWSLNLCFFLLSDPFLLLSFTTYISLALTSFTCSHSFRYSLISHSIPALCPLIASTCKIESKRS